MLFNKKQRVLATCLLAINISAVHALELGLFGDISFNGSSQENDDGKFALGQLALHASQKVDKKTIGFVEYTISSPSGVTSIERLWIKHTITPMLQIGAGQFHSPLGYWNQNYHHGKLLQDTVTRPFFINLGHEKAIFPNHLLGLKATGVFNLANGRRGSIGYDVTLSNGSSLHSPNLEGDHADEHANVAIGEKRLVVLRTNYQHPTLPIQMGLTGMTNPIVEASEDGRAKKIGDDLIHQRVLGVDLKIAMEKFDVMAEYYTIKNKDMVGTLGEHTATAYYAQLGYGLSDKLKAVYRYGELDFDKEDPFFAYRPHDEQEERHTLALRYEMNGTHTLTLEAQKRQDVTDYYLQWAFMML